jgi:hypothetical protein
MGIARAGISTIWGVTFIGFEGFVSLDDPFFVTVF